jgi:hypothetical protein
MKLDNFTAARCVKCNWLKQFQPGQDYDSKEFVCDCKVEVKEVKRRRKVKEE